MKAAYITEYGDPEALRYGDQPEPEVRPDEVLVRVRAASLNRVDLFTREGSHGTKGHLPRVLGRDLAGDVLEVGPAASGFKPGDRVLGLAYRTGAYAERAAVPFHDLWHLPETVGYEEGSSVPTVLTTAWHLLICRAHIRLGEDVLIMAAGSGVGVAAIQIAKRTGCRVFTTAGTDEKLARARELGADVGINYKTEDFAARVREETDGRGVDLVLDHIGDTVWEGCFASLKQGGRFINCGVSAGHKVELHLGRLWTRDLTLMGSSMRPREDMSDILPLLARGELKGVVARTLPLAEAAQAHRLLAASDFFGKVVLVP